MDIDGETSPAPVHRSVQQLAPQLARDDSSGADEVPRSLCADAEDDEEAPPPPSLLACRGVARHAAEWYEGGEPEGQAAPVSELGAADDEH